MNCQICNKNLEVAVDEGLIILKRRKDDKVIDVEVVCRGKCDDIRDSELRKNGYGIGTKEMNTDLKKIYRKEDFTNEALEKYENILEKIE